jgi:hypothetical protein
MLDIARLTCAWLRADSAWSGNLEQADLWWLMQDVGGNAPTVSQLQIEIAQLTEAKAAVEQRADELGRMLKTTGAPTHVRMILLTSMHALRLHHDRLFMRSHIAAHNVHSMLEYTCTNVCMPAIAPGL